MTGNDGDRLAASRVGIAGVGGLGSLVAVALARAGIGGLVLADCDRVTADNLARQYYFRDQVGEPKVAALCRTLSRIRSRLEVEPHFCRVTPDNLAPLFAGVEVLVEAFDRAEEKAWLVSHYRRLFPKVPLVAASGAAGDGPAAAIVTRRAAANLYLCGDGVSAVENGVRLEAPRVGIVAHHQALAVVRLLRGQDPVA